MRNWKIHRTGDTNYIRYYGKPADMERIRKTLEENGIEYSMSVRVTLEITKNSEMKKLISTFKNIDKRKQIFMERYLLSL